MIHPPHGVAGLEGRTHPTIPACAVIAAASLLASPGVTYGQAFVPAAGEGSVTIAYQNLHARGHLDLNGDRMTGESGNDPTQAHAIVVEAEFGVSRRLAVTVSLPYIRSKYGGSAPHRVAGVGPIQEWDDGTYHGTYQDFHFGARYNITTRPFAITPFADVVIPSHHYPSTAHAASGRDLRAYVVGVAVGGFLDSVLPRLFFQAHVSYARVQDVLDIHPNRSHLDTEAGYFISPRLAVRFLESYQVTHHGIDLISFATPMTEGVVHDHPEIQFVGVYRRNHDRLQRSNYLTLGGGVGFSVTDSLDVFANAVNMVWGENVHPLRGMTFGVSTRFRTARQRSN
jgi:hypothetical protein